MLSQRKKVRVL